MNRWLVTGAGQSVCDAWMAALDQRFAEDVFVLTDGPEVAGEARRLFGHTLIVQLPETVDPAEFDGVIDLAGGTVTETPCYVLPSPAKALVQRVLADVQVRGIVGALTEPAIAMPGGVEALAGQVSQLFNGRDPDSEPFGGSLAFNQLRRDSAELEQWVMHAQGLGPEAVSLAVHQTDLFYTTTASLWIEADASTVDALVAASNTAMDACLAAAPSRGRADDVACWQMATRVLTPTWVHVQVYADTEYGVWVTAMVDWMCGLQEVHL